MLLTTNARFLQFQQLMECTMGKNRNFGQILTFLGPPVSTPFYRWGPNLVYWSRPKVYTYVRQIHLNVFIVPASGGRRRQIWQILIFGGSCTDSRLPTRMKFSALEQTHGTRLCAKFRLDRFILSPSAGENPHFLLFFDIGILLCRQLAAVWESWTLTVTNRQTDKQTN